MLTNKNAHMTQQTIDIHWSIDILSSSLCSQNSFSHLMQMWCFHIFALDIFTILRSRRNLLAVGVFSGSIGITGPMFHPHGWFHHVNSVKIYRNVRCFSCQTWGKTMAFLSILLPAPCFPSHMPGGSAKGLMAKLWLPMPGGTPPAKFNICGTQGFRQSIMYTLEVYPTSLMGYTPKYIYIYTHLYVGL